jgi:hypothetical protein
MMDVEHIGHRPLEGRVQVDVLGVENVLDRPQRIDLAVASADDHALPDVRSDDERGAAVRIHMVGAVLHVIFSDDEQRVGGVAAVRDRFDNASARSRRPVASPAVEAAERAAETPMDRG